MNKKLLNLLCGSVLAAMLLAGCATNDQEPPPENDNIETPGDNDMNTDNNGTLNDTDLDRNDDLNGPNNTNDINTDDDGDLMEDNNTPGEELIEDNLDRNDKDTMDQ